MTGSIANYKVCLDQDGLQALSSNAYSIMVKLNFSSVFFILTTAAALVFALPVPDENTSDVQAKYVVPLHAHLTHHLTL